MLDSFTHLPVKRVWLWPLGALPLVLVALVVGLALSGAAAPRELVDPGPVVRWGLPVASALARVAATVTIGAFMLCALVLPRPAGGKVDAPNSDMRGDRHQSTRMARQSRGEEGSDAMPGAAWRRAAGIGAGSAVVWALAQLVHLLLTHAAALGTAIGGPGYGAQLIQFVRDIELGRNLGWATLLAALVAVFAVGVAGYASAAWAGVLALVVLLPVSVTGHAAGAVSHDLAVSSWWIHLGSLMMWVGGLVVLCLVAARVGPALAEVVERYSRIALWAFAITALAGTANAWLRLSTPVDLFVHPYGQLLLIKLILTVALGLAGWAHRRVTIPAIRAHTATSGSAAGWAFWRLAGVEVLIMGAVVGVAVALGSSAPPEPQEAAAGAGSVYVLTGYLQPPLPTVVTYLTQWRLDPLTTLATVTGLLVYLSWVWRLRRRGQPWPAWRVASWEAGLLVFFWATNGGPAVYGSVLFSGHMVHQMLLVVVVPIFLVLAGPLTLALRVLPNRPDGSRGPREWIAALTGSRWVAVLAHPVVAVAILAGSLVLFYYSPLFELALGNRYWHVLLIVYFTLTSCLFTSALLGAEVVRRRLSYPRRLLLVLAAMGFYAVFGMVLASQASLLAADHFGRLELTWGVDALADQQQAGAVMWAIGELPTFALAIALVIAWATARDSTQHTDGELPAYETVTAQARQPVVPADAGEPARQRPAPRRPLPPT